MKEPKGSTELLATAMRRVFAESYGGRFQALANQGRYQ